MALSWIKRLEWVLEVIFQVLTSTYTTATLLQITLMIYNFPVSNKWVYGYDIQAPLQFILSQDSVTIVTMRSSISYDIRKINISPEKNPTILLPKKNPTILLTMEIMQENIDSSGY